MKSSGGQTGWYYGNILWSLRGWLDTLTGGVGLRRGRRHPRQLLAGDALDFWRVLKVEPEQRLLLLAEMKVPGEAILEFRLENRAPNETELQQISRFLPRSLAGIAYWYSLYSLHQLIFRGMIEAIARRIVSLYQPGRSSLYRIRSRLVERRLEIALHSL